MTEVKEAADAVLDSETNTKRKWKDDDNNGNQKTSANDKNTSKRRKRERGGGKKDSHQCQNNYKRKRNWIESCSESINRIPSNCAAPVTCVITRSEIEEEIPRPKQQINGVRGDDTTRIENINTLDHGEDQSTNVTATLTKSFVDALSKEPKQQSESATADKVAGKEKKLFIPVQRHASANGPTWWQQKQNKQGHKKGQSYCHLPDGDNGDGKKNPYQKDKVPDKFWAQRKRLFSRYDEGIQIGGDDDPEMWFSVTPESIGLHIADRTLSLIKRGRENLCNSDLEKESIVIIDLFCGCGGNSIAFTRLNTNDSQENTNRENNSRVKVIAVDNNLSRLKMAANNAAVYGINKEDIVFVHADAVEILYAYEKISRKSPVDIPTRDKKHQLCSGFTMGGIELLPGHFDALFLSPPWGGLDYNIGNKYGKCGFDFKNITLESKVQNEEVDDNNLTTHNGEELLSLSVKAAIDESNQHGLVVLFLPRNIDGISVSKIAATSGIKGSIELEQNVVNGKVKTVTAYFGPSVNQSLNERMA